MVHYRVFFCHFEIILQDSKHTYMILPIAIDWDASMIAFMPDAQTLLTMVQGTDFGRPKSVNNGILLQLQLNDNIIGPLNPYSRPRIFFYLPAKIDACLSGAWPIAAGRTFPI